MGSIGWGNGCFQVVKMLLPACSWSSSFPVASFQDGGVPWAQGSALCLELLAEFMRLSQSIRPITIRGLFITSRFMSWFLCTVRHHQQHIEVFSCSVWLISHLEPDSLVWLHKYKRVQTELSRKSGEPYSLQAQAPIVKMNFCLFTDHVVSISSYCCHKLFCNCLTVSSVAMFTAQMYFRGILVYPWSMPSLLSCAWRNMQSPKSCLYNVDKLKTRTSVIFKETSTGPKVLTS